jgi:hypothetical protein
VLGFSLAGRGGLILLGIKDDTMEIRPQKNNEILAALDDTPKNFCAFRVYVHTNSDVHFLQVCQSESEKM